MITQEAVTGRMVTGTSEIGSWDEVQSPSTKNIQGSLSIQKANRTTTKPFTYNGGLMEINSKILPN